MANTTLRFDPSVVLDLQIRISRNGAGVLKFVDSNGDPVDMYETEWELLLKKVAGGPNVFRLTTGAGDITVQGADDDEVRIAITYLVSTIPSATYFYEIYRPDLKKTWFTGSAIVTNGIYEPPA